MADTGADGQDALRLLSRACRALVEEGSVSTEGLLAAYRALAPAAHPAAAADALDVETVRRWRSWGGDALLRAGRIVAVAAPPRSGARVEVRANEPGVVRLHAPAGDHAAGDALALALGLSLEAAKLAHGLSAPAEVLRAAFATPADQKAALDALARGGGARIVELAPAAVPGRVDAGAVKHLAADVPAYVVCGAGARRMHDLLSPYARRLRAELAALAHAAQAPSTRARPSQDDDVYAGIDALLADPVLVEERLSVERGDGFLPAGDGALCVTCASMADDVDRRAREPAQVLKRARALLVLVEGSAASLAAVLAALGPACRAVALVLAADQTVTPAWIAETAGGHVVRIDNAFDGAGVLTTIPSLRLAGSSRAGPVDAAAFPLVQQFLLAQAEGVLPPSTRLAVTAVSSGDGAALSRACLDVLARLGPKQRR